MIDPSANLNLENLIYISFRAAAVEINNNPYQGLKRLEIIMYSL